MIKISITIGFIVCAALYLFIANKWINQILVSIKNKRLNFFVSVLLNLVIVLLFFIQYWLITGQIQIKPFLLLIGASFLGQIIYEISGSALGITIEETKNKIGVLTVVRSFEFGLRYPWVALFNLLLALSMFAGWIIVLVIYWRHTVLTPDLLFWIAFCIFLIPQFIGTIITTEYLIPYLLSVDYDNDLRNHYFINAFNTVITNIFFIMFPLSLFYSYNINSVSLPPYWFLLISPLLLFIFCTIVPFIIGTNKFYHKQIHDINWSIDWLSSINSALAMPNDKLRKETIQEKLSVIQIAIEEQIKEHEVLQYVDESSSEEARTVSESNPNLKNIMEVFITHKLAIHRWDVRARHLQNLLTFEKNINVSSIKETRGFIKSNLIELEKEKEKLSKTKSRIATLIVSVSTALLGVVFKHYQDSLLKILTNIN